MSTLAEKIRAARQKSIDIDGHRFTYRRPTPIEMLNWLGDTDVQMTKQWFEQQFNLATCAGWRSKAIEALGLFVDDWDLTELDLFSGGTGAKAEFSADALIEYLGDHPSALNALAVAIYSSWLTFLQEQADAEKKSLTGSDSASSPNSEADQH